MKDNPNLSLSEISLTYRRRLVIVDVMLFFPMISFYFSMIMVFKKSTIIPQIQLILQLLILLLLIITIYFWYRELKNNMNKYKETKIEHQEVLKRYDYPTYIRQERKQKLKKLNKLK